MRVEIVLKLWRKSKTCLILKKINVIIASNLDKPKLLRDFWLLERHPIKYRHSRFFQELNKYFIVGLSSSTPKSRLNSSWVEKGVINCNFSNTTCNLLTIIHQGEINPSNFSIFIISGTKIFFVENSLSWGKNTLVIMWNSLRKSGVKPLALRPLAAFFHFRGFQKNWFWYL